MEWLYGEDTCRGSVGSSWNPGLKGPVFNGDVACQRGSWERLYLGLWIVSNGEVGARGAGGSSWKRGFNGAGCSGGIACRGARESSWILR